MAEYKIETVHDYTSNTKVLFEHDIQFNGYSYLVIYGKHINGGFIAIPNWNICAEAGDSVLYNTEKLIDSGLDQNTAQTIATHINDVLKKVEG